MNVFTEISTRELENTLKGKAVRYIVNDAGEGLCLFFEGWTDNTGSNHGDAIHISPVIDAAGSLLCSMSRKRDGPKTAKPLTTALRVSNPLAA